VACRRLRWRARGRRRVREWRRRSRNDAIGAGVERATDEEFGTSEEREGQFAFQHEELLEVGPVAAGIFDAGKPAGFEKAADGGDFDTGGEDRNVVEQDGQGVAGFAREGAVELFDLALTIAEEVGRHEHEGVGSGGDGVVGELERAGESGVGNAGDERDAAALGGEGKQAAAFGEGIVDELAGRAEDADAIDTGGGEEVDEFEGGGIVGFPAFWGGAA